MAYLDNCRRLVTKLNITEDSSLQSSATLMLAPGSLQLDGSLFLDHELFSDRTSHKNGSIMLLNFDGSLTLGNKFPSDSTRN